MDWAYSFAVCRPAMKLSKNHLSVAAVAAKDDFRPILQYVYAFKDGQNAVSVASDSFALVEVVEPLTDDSGASQGYIRADHAKKAASQLGVRVNPEADMGLATLNAGGVIFDVQQDMQYPNYRKLFKFDEPKARIVFNPQLMRRLLEVYKNDEEVVLEVRGETEPIMLKSINEQTVKTGFLLPIKRLDNAD